MPTTFDLRHRSINPALVYFFGFGSRRLHGSVLRIGHRGAAGHAPENTLASVENAISLGVDLVEVDVQRTSDGHLVIIHDIRVDRTTNGAGLVSGMSLRALRELYAGVRQHIPRVEELLRTPGLCPHRVREERQRHDPITT